MKEKSSTIIDDAKLIVAHFVYLKNGPRKKGTKSVESSVAH